MAGGSIRSGSLVTAARRLGTMSSWPAWGFATSFVLTQVLGHHIVLSGLAGTGQPNHLSPLTVSDAFLLPLIPLVALGIMVIEGAAQNPLSGQLRDSAETSPRARWALFAGVIVLCWSPWLAAFSPGGLPMDTVQALSQGPGAWDNHHPLGFTLLAKLFVDTGVILGNPNAGLFAYALVQSLVMSAVLSYGVVFIASRGAPKWYCWTVIAFYSLAASIPAFAISMVKDVPFSLAVVGLTFFLVRVVESDGAILRDNKELRTFALLALCVMVIRNNGLPLVAALIPLVGVTYRKHSTKFVLGGAALVVGLMIVQGPGFSLLGIENRRTTVESVGPALQQIGYIAASGGNFTQEQRQTLDNVLPMPLWSELYNSEVVDPIKSHEDFDGAYLNDNLLRFLATWGGVVASNPLMALEAYALGTYGYWAAFDDHPNWAPWIESNEIGIQRDSIVPREVTARLYWVFIRTPRAGGGFPSEGLFFWIIAATLAVLAIQRRWKTAIASLPCLLLWLTFMLGTPTAYGLRYVLPLALCAPILAFLPFYRTKQLVDVVE